MVLFGLVIIFITQFSSTREQLRCSLGYLYTFFCVSFLVFGHCPAYFFTLDNHQHNFGLGYLWNSEITGNAISVSYISFNLKKVGSHPHSTLESGTFQSVLERYTVNDLINAQLPINAPYLIDTPLWIEFWVKRPSLLNAPYLIDTSLGGVYYINPRNYYFFHNWCLPKNKEHINHFINQ